MCGWTCTRLIAAPRTPDHTTVATPSILHSGGNRGRLAGRTEKDDAAGCEMMLMVILGAISPGLVTVACYGRGVELPQQ